GGGALRGRDALAIYFARVLPSVLPMRSRISDFRMGSDMAYVTLETVRQSSLGADSLVETTGRDALVMRRGAFGDWSIVWHLVRPETIVRRAIPKEPPPQPAAATPAPPRANESAGAPAEEAGEAKHPPSVSDGVSRETFEMLDA
ncbi:MAG: hypothetical protein JO306_14940, partial [Gemmatimonadetes bacterium]|nr:hypothetical protein [Gemmatimonadota bacterium]